MLQETPSLMYGNVPSPTCRCIINWHDWTHYTDGWQVVCACIGSFLLYSMQPESQCVRLSCKVFSYFVENLSASIIRVRVGSRSKWMPKHEYLNVLLNMLWKSCAFTFANIYLSHWNTVTYLNVFLAISLSILQVVFLLGLRRTMLVQCAPILHMK